jgi:hypothetical protein
MGHQALAEVQPSRQSKGRNMFPPVPWPNLVFCCGLMPVEQTMSKHYSTADIVY